MIRCILGEKIIIIVWGNLTFVIDDHFWTSQSVLFCQVTGGHIVGSPLSTSEAITYCLKSCCSKLPLATSRLGRWCSYIADRLIKFTKAAAHLTMPYDVLTIFTWPSSLLHGGLCLIFSVSFTDSQWLKASLPVKYVGCPHLHFLPSWPQLQAPAGSSSPCLGNCANEWWRTIWGNVVELVWREQTIASRSESHPQAIILR